MKPMKLTSLVVMLLVGFSAAAQEEFFDDVYFSSSKEKKKEKTEEKVIQPKKEKATESSSAIVLASASDSHPAFDKDRDVDEYNRRYTSVDVEEPYDVYIMKQLFHYYETDFTKDVFLSLIRNRFCSVCVFCCIYLSI